MEPNQSIQNNKLKIDSFELLIRFLQKCKNDSEANEARAPIISSCADIIAAAYYYRKFPNVNDFIEKHLKNKENYFYLQWARSTWSKFDKMTAAELGDLVINQILTIDNFEEDE
jgi:hypothetical protein